MLPRIADNLDIDLAEALVRIGLPDSKSRCRSCPGPRGWIRTPPPASARSWPSKPCRRCAWRCAERRSKWVLVDVVGRDHVDRNAFVFGHRAHVVGRHHAGVVRAVGEHDHHLAARHFGGVAQRQQQGVVERGIVAATDLRRPKMASPRSRVRLAARERLRLKV
jgi:hypothetical protein